MFLKWLESSDASLTRAVNFLFEVSNIFFLRQITLENVSLKNEDCVVLITWKYDFRMETNAR